MHVLTRYDLYNLVWSTPMMKLAEQYGISGKGLAKICARMDLPVPPRGYWAKVNAGHKPPCLGLPPEGPDTVLRYEIDLLNSICQKAVAKKKQPVELNGAREKISLKERLEDLHPLVRSTQKVCREGIRPFYGKPKLLPRWVSINVSKSKLNAALLFLENLIRHFEEKGLSFVCEWDLDPEAIKRGADAFRCSVYYEHMKCGFDILDDSKIYSHVPPSGLSLRAHRRSVLEKEWCDVNGLRLPERIPEIADWFVQYFRIRSEGRRRATAEAERARIEGDDRARERKKREAERREADRVAAIKSRAESDLWEMSEKSAKADVLEAYILRVAATAPADWLQWARENLATMRIGGAQPWEAESFRRTQLG